MKMKTLAMLAVSGLMAASIAYVLPAFAEDAANDIDGSVPMQLAMGDDTGASDSSASDSNSGATDSGNSAGSSSDSSSGGAAPTAASNAGATSDQPAQGDDDY